MHSNSLSQRDKKHDHQKQLLQSIVYLSIAHREPSESQTWFPMVADSAVFIVISNRGQSPMVGKLHRRWSPINYDIWKPGFRIWFILIYLIIIETRWGSVEKQLRLKQGYPGSSSSLLPYFQLQVDSFSHGRRNRGGTGDTCPPLSHKFVG